MAEVLLPFKFPTDTPICIADIPIPESEYGDLRRLKTAAELLAGEDTSKFGPMFRRSSLTSIVDAYICEVPAKSTKKAVDAIKPSLPIKTKNNLQHLRRVCPAEQLPNDVRERLMRRGSNASVHSAVSTPTSASSTGSAGARKAPKILYLLLCEASLVDVTVIEAALAENFPEPPKVFAIPVPLCAPVSPAQASRLSSVYWPTLYKNTNPYGAHPAEQARREGEIMDKDGVHKWLTLAERVAAQGMENRLGLGVGCVVVERSPEFGTRVVATAADARWCGLLDSEGCSDVGNVMGHAVMRAIGMVAQKRRIVDGKENGRFGKQSQTAADVPSPDQPQPNGTENGGGSSPDGAALPAPKPLPPLPPPEEVERKLAVLAKLPETHTGREELPLSARGITPTLSKALPLYKSPISNTYTAPFLDRPLIPVEATHFAMPALLPRGYLCLNLELYTTHEPCVMCSMALLHSRFGRVIFGREMDKTGGLKAEKQVNKSSPKGQRVQDLFISEEDKENPTISGQRRGGQRAKRPPVINVVLANGSAVGSPLPSPTTIAGKPERIGYGLFWRPQLNWKFLCWQWDKKTPQPKNAASSVFASGEEFDDVADLQVHLEAISLVQEAQMNLAENVHA